MAKCNIQQPYSDKLNVMVDFPVSGLNLSSLVRCPDVVETVYDLYAVCNHIGGAKDGHCGYIYKYMVSFVCVCSIFIQIFCGP